MEYISNTIMNKRMNIMCTHCTNTTYDKLDIQYKDSQYPIYITKNYTDEINMMHYCRWCKSTTLHYVIPNKMAILLDTLQTISRDYKFTVESCSIGDLEYTIKRTKSDKNKIYNLKGNKISSGPLCLPYIEFVFLKKNRYHIDKFKLKLNDIFENNGFRCIVVNDDAEDFDNEGYYKKHYVLRYEYNRNILDTLVNNMVEIPYYRRSKIIEFGLPVDDMNDIESISYVMSQALHDLINHVLDRLNRDIKAEQNKL